MSERPTRPADGRHTPRLPGLLPVTAIAVGLLLAGLVGLFLLFAWLSGVPIRFPLHVPSGTLADLLRSVISGGTLIAGTFAIVYAYRKQRIDEAASHRADSEQLSKRYQDAASQLGHERSAVRLAGIYALARLADDWPEKRQMCVDLLCAYLRMPYPNGNLDADEVVVRQAATEVFRDHLTDPADPLSWCDLVLDFSGAVFVNAAFSGSQFRNGVSFSGATFTGLRKSLERGVYVGGGFRDCVFAGQVSFFQARVRDAVVSFDGSTFDVEELWFGGLKADDSNIFFRNCEFLAGHVYFGGVRIARKRSSDTLGNLWFDRSVFSGARVQFNGLTLTGGVHCTFDDVTLAGGSLEFADVDLMASDDLTPDMRLRIKAAEEGVLREPVPDGVTVERPGENPEE